MPEVVLVNKKKEMRAIMVGAEKCVKCHQVETILRDRGLWPAIEYVDAGTEYGKRLLAEHKQKYLPFFIMDGKAYARTGEFMRVLTPLR